MIAPFFCLSVRQFCDSFAAMLPSFFRNYLAKKDYPIQASSSNKVRGLCFGETPVPSVDSSLYWGSFCQSEPLSSGGACLLKGLGSRDSSAAVSGAGP